MNNKNNWLIFILSVCLWVDCAFSAEYIQIDHKIKNCFNKKVNCIAIDDSLRLTVSNDDISGKLSSFTDGKNYIMQFAQEPDDEYPSYKIYIYRRVSNNLELLTARWSWDSISIRDLNEDGISDVVLYENPFGIADSRIFKWPVLIDGVSFCKTLPLTKSISFMRSYLVDLEKSVSTLQKQCDKDDVKCITDLSHAKTQLDTLSGIIK